MLSRRSISARFWRYCPNSEDASRLSSKVRTIWAVLSGATKIDSSVSGVRNSGSCAKKSGLLFGLMRGLGWGCGGGGRRRGLRQEFLRELTDQAVAEGFRYRDGGDLADE